MSEINSRGFGQLKNEKTAPVGAALVIPRGKEFFSIVSLELDDSASSEGVKIFKLKITMLNNINI